MDPREGVYGARRAFSSVDEHSGEHSAITHKRTSAAIADANVLLTFSRRTIIRDACVSSFYGGTQLSTSKELAVISLKNVLAVVTCLIK